jgi:hypothetical protein
VGELLRDQHTNESYFFESDAEEIPATIQEDQAIVIATQWAMRFYNDAFPNTENCEYRVATIRFWLVTFIGSKAKKRFMQSCCRMERSLNRRGSRVSEIEIMRRQARSFDPIAEC